LGKKIEIKNQTSPIWFVGFSFLIFVIYLLLNSKTCYINDDYTYRLVFEYWRISANPVKVASIHDIYISMRNHYMVWGGRIPVHTVVQLLLWLVNKKIFNIINSLMVVLLGALAYFHVNFGRKRSIFLYIFIFTMLWFFMPQPELTMLDLTNSVNNMWVCVYILIFLIPYRILLAREVPFKHNAVLSVLMVPLGFLAGWSNEPGGAAAGMMALLVIAYFIKNRKKTPVWAFSGVAALAAGWVIMVFAPGYRVKADKYYGVPNVLKNAIDNFGKIESNLLEATFKSLWPMFLMMIISLIVLFRLRKMRNTNSRMKPSGVRKKTFENSSYIPEAFYVIGAFASVVIYVIAPDFQPRYLFPAAMFLIIAAGIIISRIIDETAFNGKFRCTVAAVLMCSFVALFMADAIYEYDIVSYNFELTSTIEKNITKQVEQGQKNVVIKGEYQFLSAGRYSIYKNLYKFGIQPEMIWGGNNSKDEINRLIAANFGAETYINEADMDYVRSK